MTRIKRDRKRSEEFFIVDGKWRFFKLNLEKD
jgi:hypothetical protein